MTTRDANEVVTLLGRSLLQEDFAKFHSCARTWALKFHIRTGVYTIGSNYQYSNNISGHIIISCHLFHHSFLFNNCHVARSRYSFRYRACLLYSYDIRSHLNVFPAWFQSQQRLGFHPYSWRCTNCWRNMPVSLTKQSLRQLDHNHHHHRLDRSVTITLGHSWNAKSIVSVYSLVFVQDCS
jgi:hypothetical protein